MWLARGRPVLRKENWIMSNGNNAELAPLPKHTFRRNFWQVLKTIQARLRFQTKPQNASSSFIPIFVTRSFICARLAASIAPATEHQHEKF